MNSADTKHRINDLLSKNADKYDPVRFAYIRSLVTRAESLKQNNNTLLLAKAVKAIEQYEVELEECRPQTKAILDSIIKDFPSHAERADKLFSRCEFKQLEKLNLRLRRNQSRRDNLAVLSDLKSTINSTVEKIAPSKADLSFEDLLAHQAQDALDRDDVQLVEQNDPHKQTIELQSMRAFRESVKHVNIDRIIDRAINDYPENPGPHNPHMLAIKSLTQMQKLSPHYLRRFASYIETLLWLEKNALKLSEGKK